MPASDVTLAEVSAAIPASEVAFKTWFDARISSLPDGYTFADLMSAMLQSALIAQSVKNSGVTVAADQLASYTAAVTTPTIDPATGLDLYRKTLGVVQIKVLGGFDGEAMRVVAAG